MDGKFNNTQQEEEIFDEELQALGIPFTDETAPREMPVFEKGNPAMGRQQQKENCREGTACREGQGKAVDASYASFVKPEANLQKRLVGCTKWMGICGSIAMLLWWFQVNDLMAIQAAYPCICVCGVLGGFGVGMHAKR